MSVLVSDRKESKFEAITYSVELRNQLILIELLPCVESIAKLKARGSENLSEYTAKTAFESKVEATQLFKYGEDFFIGDIVQIANEYDHEGRAYISELVISQNEDGVSIYPTFQTI